MLTDEEKLRQDLVEFYVKWTMDWNSKEANGSPWIPSNTEIINWSDVMFNYITTGNKGPQDK